MKCAALVIVGVLVAGCSGTKRRDHATAGHAAAAAVAASESRAPQPAPAAAYADPFVRRSRVPGSTFIEILEVRARADGTLLYCTAVRGLQVVDARSPAAMELTAELRPSLGHERFSRCQHLDWSEDVVYLSNRGDRIQPTPFIAAFDIAQSPPRELATYTKAGVTFEGIAVAGDRNRADTPHQRPR